jgi:hypothetical protein
MECNLFPVFYIFYQILFTKASIDDAKTVSIRIIFKSVSLQENTTLKEKPLKSVGRLQ